MKTISWIVGVVVVLGGLFYVVNTYIYQEKQDTNEQTMAPLALITPLEHASGILQFGDITIYFDPTGGEAAYAGKMAPDIILITDVHGDHLSTSTLAAIADTATVIVPEAVKEMLPGDLKDRAKVLANGETLEEQGLTVTAVPMYNLPEAENSNFHTPGRGNGYIVEKDSTRVYIAGDTAGTPEMRALTNISIALLPMNLPYTMGVEEAADATLAFKPRQVIPYHYRGGDGLADINRFKQLVNAGDRTIEVVLLNWYPNQ